MSPGLSGWRTVNVSAWVPVGATGVILQDVNTAGDRYEYGVRHMDCNLTWMLTEQSSRHESLGWHMVGLDANREFELYHENSSLKTYLLGYTMEGVTFFVDAIDMLVTAGGWQDVNVGLHTGTDTAIGAIFVVMDTTRTDYLVGLEMKGSTDFIYNDKDKGDCDVALIGLDENQFAQTRIENNAVHIYLIGYVTSGAVFFENAVLKDTSTIGDYAPMDITDDLNVGDDANGAILKLVAGGAFHFGVRPKDAPAPYDFHQRLTELKWPIGATTIW